MDWDARSILLLKRDGGVLPDEAIRWFMEAYVAGDVEDDQAAALCMAIYFQGMEPGELSAWTEAMIASGVRVDLSDVGRPTVDKHSTGGVGDKVSLVVCPLLAACGAAVPQLGGRALGHTGGTLDKMESIPGWRPELAPPELQEILRTVGAVIATATSEIAPADARLYGLRDRTATVASIPLIASSIMSKKIAEGTRSLVLDIKVGRGAFMTEEARAQELAETMIGIGERAGVRTTALLTRMDAPLGRCVGNALEVAEAVATLRGDGPEDLLRVSLAVAEEMIRLAGLDADPRSVLESGAAFEGWNAMVRAQGGDPDRALPRAAHTTDVVAEGKGWLHTLDALAVGHASMRLGAGRSRRADRIAPGAGVECLVKPGEAVEVGQPLLRLHADDATRFEPVRAILADAVRIVEEPVAVPDPIIRRVDAR